MAIINFANREIITSIVYFGAPGSGTTSNVRYLFDHLPTEEKSGLYHFSAHNEHHESRFFDYLPSRVAPINGFTTRFRVFSLPGEIRDLTHRDLILRQVDGLVFVADSRRVRATENTRYLLELEASLHEHGIDLAKLPLVFQLNHRDGDNLVSEAELSTELNPYGFPVTEANAKTGAGVLATHDTVYEALNLRIHANLQGDPDALRLNPIHHGSRETAEEVHTRILHELREAAPKGKDRESAEEASRSRLRKRYAHLKTKNTFHLQWMDQKLGHLHPFLILGSKVSQHGVELDVLLKGQRIEDPRRITLSITGHAPAAETINAETEASPPPLQYPQPVTPPPPPSRNDLPPVTYGFVGVLGGGLIGFFIMFLFFG